jgi:hypothetical protein
MAGDSTTLLTSLTCDSLTVNSGNTFYTNGYNVNCGGAVANGGTINATRNGTNATVIYAAGNWTDTGTLIPDNSIVALNGNSQSINGATTFYGLTKKAVSSATLTFDHTNTQTVTGYISLEGSNGQLLLLRSDLSGSQFALNLNNAAYAVLRYIDLKDANNASTNPLALVFSTNSGNNTNWIFALDAGLRYYDGASTVIPACEYQTPLLSLLRIRKNTNTYGVCLTPVNDPYASRFRISTSHGLMAVKKYL